MNQFDAVQHDDILRLVLQAFRGLVGRAYRGVNAHDQVPTLPPISDYRAVGYAIWIDNGEPLLQVSRSGGHFLADAWLMQIHSLLPRSGLLQMCWMNAALVQELCSGCWKKACQISACQCLQVLALHGMLVVGQRCKRNVQQHLSFLAAFLTCHDDGHRLMAPVRRLLTTRRS